jgi:hypothetical protein
MGILIIPFTVNTLHQNKKSRHINDGFSWLGLLKINQYGSLALL